jgi:DNA-binding MarR family transcriptional regulator
MEKWQVNRDQYSVTVDLGPNSEWVAEMQWPEGETQGGPAVLVIYPSDPDTRPPGGLSQTVLRDVDFGYARDRLRASLSNSKRWENARQRSEDTLSSLLIEHAGGAITQEYLALLSRVYVGAVKNGQDKPLDHLAAITGNSPAAIKNHLWQATRKGLLERSPGRAGGHLTDKGREVLATLAPAEDELTIAVEMPPRVIEDKPKRRRPPKAITSRAKT